MKSLMLSAGRWGSLFFALALAARAGNPDANFPHLEHKDGRHALIVDGAPFLILGGQSHNSSAWPATLPRVWSAIEALSANTLEAPISWEQFEPEPGHFDYSIVSTLLKEARQHHVRLVLLWFATWKNGSSHYLPLWLKEHPELSPRIIGRDGRRVDSPSPFAPETLKADVRAFAELMKYLKRADSVHTVIMVQVENEAGAWNAIRDYSPEAEKHFAEPVPSTLLEALGRTEPVGGNWTAIFGANADEYFHAWSVAHYIGEVAAAGKAAYPLPLYVNAALRDPLTNPAAGTYESGGPTDNVLAIWKAAAPALDVLAPDIYLPEAERYTRVLDLYTRPDNPLFVPETGGGPIFARYCFFALAHGAIGWTPFGIDEANYNEGPEAAERHQAALAPIAANYRAIGPVMRTMAQLSFEGKLKATFEEKGILSKTLSFGTWTAKTTFGAPTFGYGKKPEGNSQPVGRALIAQLSESEFLVTAYECRVDFALSDPAANGQRDFVRVEEGTGEGESFRPARILNGDETDYGLTFGNTPRVLRVRLGTF